jgi:hypothetical protein
VSSSSTDGCALSRASVRLFLSGNGWESAGEGEQSSKKNTRHHLASSDCYPSHRDDAIATSQTDHRGKCVAKIASEAEPTYTP